MLLVFILRHRLSRESLVDLLTLLDILFPGTLPATKFLFDKCFVSIKSRFEIHFYCESCHEYVCKDSNLVDVCRECQSLFNKAHNPRNGSFFIDLPLAGQLRDILENQLKDAQTLIDKTLWSWNDHVRDIFDGNMMKTYIQNGTMGKWDVSLLWNSDGVPVFESSQYSLWPIQFTINEFPPNIRKDHVMLSSIWFDKSKPVMNIFLKLFITEMQSLQDHGLEWFNGEVIRKSRVFAVVRACNSVARPLLKHSSQFNGKYGCDWCLHRGERVAKGRGYVNVYPFVDPPAERRELNLWEDDAIQASQDGCPVNGVKGVSPLLFLLLFNIISSFVPDYMHAVLLGIVRQFLCLWIDSSNHTQPWYFGTKLNVRNKRLLAMKGLHAHRHHSTKGNSGKLRSSKVAF